MFKTKICTKCGIKKPINEFNKNINCNDGYTSQCKRCNALYRREKRIKEGMTKPVKLFENLGVTSDKNDHLYQQVIKESKTKIKLYKPPTIPKSVCNALQQHEDDMRCDPERLSTDFIAEILFCHEPQYYVKYLKQKTFNKK